jgi:hypothetical protein
MYYLYYKIRISRHIGLYHRRYIPFIHDPFTGYFNYSKAYELVEMIELNRILGAEHFVFYNYSTNSNVNHVLEYYKKMDIVEVLEWNLPMKVDTWPKKNEPVEIHYFAQLAALNISTNSYALL